MSLFENTLKMIPLRLQFKENKEMSNIVISMWITKYGKRNALNILKELVHEGQYDCISRRTKKCLISFQWRTKYGKELP